MNCGKVVVNRFLLWVWEEERMEGPLERWNLHWPGGSGGYCWPRVQCGLWPFDLLTLAGLQCLVASKWRHQIGSWMCTFGRGFKGEVWAKDRNEGQVWVLSSQQWGGQWQRWWAVLGVLEVKAYECGLKREQEKISRGHWAVLLGTRTVSTAQSVQEGRLGAGYALATIPISVKLSENWLTYWASHLWFVYFSVDILYFN